MPAAVLFVDVAGFTRMSERFGVVGSSGTEQLTALLDAAMTSMIDIIESFNGDVLTFGGDALTILFWTPGGRGAAPLGDALQCAVQLREELDQRSLIQTSAGQFNLAAKAGLAVGEVTVGIAGDAQRWLHFGLGGPLTAAAAAEHLAERGDIVVQRRAAELVPSARTAPTTDAAHVRLLARSRVSAPAPIPAPPEAPGLDPARFLDPGLARRLAAGDPERLAEHRTVTTLFLNWRDAAPATDDLVKRVITHLERVLVVVRRLDGHLLQVSSGDKGEVVMVVFGAPATHEEDEGRALACALELRDLPAVECRVGVSTGRAFCGLVGSERRRAYTVIGDSVNVAARLMEEAEWGEVLVASGRPGRSGQEFRLTPLESRRLRGRSLAVEVHRVTGLIDAPAPNLLEPVYGQPLVGRGRELALADEALAAARAGNGSTLVITGTSGSGKSRLAAAVAGRARREGFDVVGGAFQLYRSAEAYLGWRDVWGALLGVEERSPEAALAALSPDLVSRAPLLAPVLGLQLDDNELTGALEAEARSEWLQGLLLDVLRARSVPVLVVLEDCHWMDERSRDLLSFLARTIHDLPVMLLALYRVGLNASPPLLAGNEAVRWLALDELDPEHVDAMVKQTCAKVFDATPSPAFLRATYQRAGGNPLFIEEAIELLAQRGGRPDDAGASLLAELPDHASAVIQARVDQLAEGLVAVLRQASVLGGRFGAAQIAGSFGLGREEDVLAELTTLHALDLLAVDPGSDGDTYMFRHAMVRDVVYSTLPDRTRRRLHGEAGAYFERLGARPEEYAELLVHHFTQSGDVARQRRYLRLAADAARLAFANDVAVAHYQRLLPLTAPEELPGVLLDLGEVEELAGGSDLAESHLREALRLGTGPTRARAAAALGSRLLKVQSYDAALEWLLLSQRLATAEDDHATLGRALDRLAWCYTQRGAYARAREYASQQLAEALEAGDEAAAGAAHVNLGLVSRFLQEDDDALAHLRLAQESAWRSGDLRLLVHATNDLAGVHIRRGDYAATAAALAEASRVADGMGYRRALAELSANEAELRLLQGDLDGALARFVRAHTALTELGDALGGVNELAGAAQVLALQGRPAEAAELYRRVLVLGRDVERPFYFAEYLLAYAEFCAARGEFDAAARANDEALATAVRSSNRQVETGARLLSTLLEVMTGRLSSASAVERLRGLLAQAGPEERAAVADQLWQLDPRREDARRLAAETYRQLHARTPKDQYRRRYAALTGEHLTPPRLLDPVPDAELATDRDLAGLFARVGAGA